MEDIKPLWQEKLHKFAHGFVPFMLSRVENGCYSSIDDVISSLWFHSPWDEDARKFSSKRVLFFNRRCDEPYLRPMENETIVLLLVDEISKTKRLGDDVPDYFRSELCRLADGDRQEVRHLVIFSSLEIDMMLRETTASGRTLKPLLVLPLFTLEDSRALLNQATEKLLFADDKFREISRDRAMSWLATITGGQHPRSLYYCMRYL
eukprot:scaffold423_cov185-Ochromonas_danica.AAC.4